MAFTVCIENVTVAKTKSLLHAFQLLIATYYSFNAAYPSKGSRTLTFIQKAVLNIQDGVKSDTKVSDLISKWTVM